MNVFICMAISALLFASTVPISVPINLVLYVGTEFHNRLLSILIKKYRILLFFIAYNCSYKIN